MSELKEQKLEGARAQGKQKLLFVGLFVLLTAGVFLFLSFSNFPTPSQTPQSALPAEQTSLANPASENPEDRGEFLATHKVFELDKVPRLDLMSLTDWNPESMLEITEVKDKAIRAFESGNYRAAVQLMQQSIEMADEQIRNGQELFVLNMQGAKDAHQLNNYDPAKEAIDMAILLDPLNHPARDFADRIALLPDLIPLLDKLANAKAENQPRNELGITRKILAIDPVRIELDKRIKILTSQIAEQSFSTAINQAEQALDKENIEKARSSLKTAQKLFPRRDLSFMQVRIADLSLQKRLANTLREADEASQAENWSMAVSQFSAALRLDPDNSSGARGFKTSTAVLNSQRQLQSHLDSPLRLGSKNVADAARQTLATASLVEQHSAILRSRINLLEKYLQKAAVPAKITISSDGETEIKVRGVGLVGKVTQKTIELVPGNYTLEGRRAGYKSKLVNLTVAFDVRSLWTSVVCDERI